MLTRNPHTYWLPRWGPRNIACSPHWQCSKNDLPSSSTQSKLCSGVTRNVSIFWAALCFPITDWRVNAVTAHRGSAPSTASTTYSNRLTLTSCAILTIEGQQRLLGHLWRVSTRTLIQIRLSAHMPVSARWRTPASLPNSPFVVALTTHTMRYKCSLVS